LSANHLNLANRWKKDEMPRSLDKNGHSARSTQDSSGEKLKRTKMLKGTIMSESITLHILRNYFCKKSSTSIYQKLAGQCRPEASWRRRTPVSKSKQRPCWMLQELADFEERSMTS